MERRVNKADGDGTQDRWPVFLSSTFRELEQYRRAVENRYLESPDLVEAIRLELLDAEDYSRVAQDPADLSVRKVSGCDLVVMLVGKQLGSRSDDGRSYTELEFDAARQQGIPVLAFVLDDGATDIRPPEFEYGGRGSQQWWEQQQQRAVADSIGGKVTWIGQPNVVLKNPGDVADEVVSHLRQWLEGYAKPHKYHARDGQLRFFIDHDVPYQQLKQRVKEKQISIVFGPSGLGKSTLIEALESDSEIKRKFALPAVRRNPDLQLETAGGDNESSLDGFRREAEEALRERARDAGGRPVLFVVEVSALARRGDAGPVLPSDDAVTHIARQLKGALPSRELGSEVSIVFEVVEKELAFAIEQSLVLQHARIEVKPLDSAGAADLLLAGGGLHLNCKVCAHLAPKVAQAAGFWPPLIWVCARAFSRAEGDREAQHDTLRVDAAIQRLQRDEAMYATFRFQLEQLDEGSRNVLDAFAAFLPRPFSTSDSILAALTELSQRELKTHLDLLIDRGYLERADLSGGKSDKTDKDKHYAIHPFFWNFLTGTAASEKGGGTSRVGAEELHRKALNLLDSRVDDTVKDDLLYEGWGELENPARQSLIANWIYQLAFDEERRIAAEAFVRLYLQAHWWWGSYIPFQFCDFVNHLGNKAESWTPKRGGDDPLEIVVAQIRHIHDEYPKTGQFEDQPGDGVAGRWAGVQADLVQIAECLHIPVKPDEKAVRLWAAEIPGDDTGARSRLLDLAKFLHIFLAHCARGLYRTKPLDQARLRLVEQHYGCALSLAKKQRDGWNQPWILYELADAQWTASRAWAADGRHDEKSVARCADRARTGATKGWSIAKKQGEKKSDELDYEVLAQCERLLGDTYWSTDKSIAVDHLMRAVHYAHCFELWPEHQPDEYSLHFERHMRSVVVRTLRGASAAGGHDPADETDRRALVEQVATFLGKHPGEVWDAWQAALLELGDDRHADERLSTILFEPGVGAYEASTAGYRLPPWHGTLANCQWVRAVKQNQVVAFRHEAKAAIRAVEERDVDQELVRLPESEED